MESVLFLVFVAGLALVCEYIDSALGGGYGTILTPILLILGLDKAMVVPAILITEFFTGIISAIMHHRAGNANFTLEIDRNLNKKALLISQDAKIAIILGIFGVLGGVVAALVAINIPAAIVNTYIGILVTMVGLLVLLNFKWKFSWAKIVGIGLLAAFNKGMSGGGYGPLVSSGQIVTDRNPKQAVASTSLSEAAVCAGALIIYILTKTFPFNFQFVLALLAGALSSVPFAVLTVKKIQVEKFQPLVGIITCGLGVWTLVKTWSF
ncbi:MAG: sulfite exporter TauE/SafE family protein [Promethearchaeota archaeon]